MRIGFSFDHLYPADTRAGRHVENLVRRMRENGHEVFVITTPTKDALEPEGVGMMRLRDEPGARRHLRGDALMVKAITRFMRQNGVQVHFAEGLTPLTAIVAKAAHRAGVKTIARVLADDAGIVHGFGSDRKLSPSVLRKRIATVLEHVDAAAASSDRCAELLKECYDGSMQVIEKCVDLHVCNPERVQPFDIETVRQKLEIEGKRVLVYARESMRAETVKSTIPLVQALAARNPDLVLVVAGDVDRQRELEDAVAAAGLSSAYRISGVLSQRDLFALHRTAEAFLAPAASRASETELLEAMAMGCPLVCYPPKVETAPGLIADSGALVLGDVDPAVDAEALLALLGDPERHQGLRRRAAEVAGRLDIAFAVEKVESLCKELWGDRPMTEPAASADDSDDDEGDDETASDAEDEAESRPAPRGRGASRAAPSRPEKEADEAPVTAAPEAPEDAEDDFEADRGSARDEAEDDDPIDDRREDFDAAEGEDEIDDEEGDAAAEGEADEGGHRRRRRRHHLLRHEDDGGAPGEGFEDRAPDVMEAESKGASSAPPMSREEEEKLLVEAGKRLRELDPKLTLRDLMPFLRPPKHAYVFALASGQGQHRAGEAIFEAFRGVDQNLKTKQFNIADFFERPMPASELEVLLARESETTPWVGAESDGTSTESESGADSLFGGKLKSLILEKRPHQIVLTHWLPLAFLDKLKADQELRMRISVVVTEYDFHPHWIAAGVDHYLVPTEKVRFKMIRSGVAPEKIEAVGIPVHPRFEESVDRDRVRRDLGIKGGQPTVLFRPGGMGEIAEITRILTSITSVGMPFSLVVLAGKNEALVKAIEAIEPARGVQVKTFGFVPNIHEVMAISDLMITGAVGHTVAEAFAAGLPMVLYRPTEGLESRAADWFVERGIALKAHDPLDLEWLITDLLRNHGRTLRDMRQAAESGGRPRRGAAAVAVERICRELH